MDSLRDFHRVLSEMNLLQCYHLSTKFTIKSSKKLGLCRGKKSAHSLLPLQFQPNWLGQQLWAKKKEEEILCGCSDCGLVWFQKRSDKLGFDHRAVGYYDDCEHPWEFVPSKGRFRIPERNTSSYWSNVGRKSIRPPRWGGVD
jgi:hypothetical protein